MPKRVCPTVRAYPDDVLPIYHKIYREFKKEMIQEIINNADGVTLPGGLGFVRMKGIKYSPKRMISKTTSNANPHTGGYIFSVEWFSLHKSRFEDRKDRRIFQEASMYCAYTTRPMKRAIFNNIMNGNWYHWDKYDGRKKPDDMSSKLERYKWRAKRAKNIVKEAST